MRYVVITVDHEIFGNGSGDVKQHVIEPAERMARICEEYRAPLTIFFETEEYAAFERCAQQYNAHIGYDAAGLMREQAKDFSRRGHDLQLHLHPQWYGAGFANGRWDLRFDKLTVDSLFESQEETNAYISERKAMLHELCCPSSQKDVSVYRAGGFAAQPGRKLLPALAASGFVADSSVAPGLHRERAHVAIDFRHTPANRCRWRISNEVTQEDPKGPLYEIPIGSTIRRWFTQITPRRLKAKFSKQVPRDRQMEMLGQLKVGRNPFAIARFLMRKDCVKFDYHNLSACTLHKWIKNAAPATNGGMDVSVLIGHTKEHTDDAEFRRLLKLISSDTDLKIVSFSEIADRLRTELSINADGGIQTAETLTAAA